MRNTFSRTQTADPFQPFLETIYRGEKRLPHLRSVGVTPRNKFEGRLQYQHNICKVINKRKPKNDTLTIKLDRYLVLFLSTLLRSKLCLTVRPLTKKFKR